MLHVGSNIVAANCKQLFNFNFKRLKQNTKITILKKIKFNL